MDKIQIQTIDGPPSKDPSDQILHWRAEAETMETLFRQCANKLNKITDILESDQSFNDQIHKIRNVIGD